MCIKRALVLLALLVTFQSGCANEAVDNIPDDVVSFIKKREACETLRGEIPDSNPENSKEINEVVSQVNSKCKGADMDLARIKAKYAGDERVLNRISGYEEHIESN